jgi:hypothetical protein
VRIDVVKQPAHTNAHPRRVFMAGIVSDAMPCDAFVAALDIPGERAEDDRRG